MKKNLFIGIDFSKSKFDVTVLETIEQKNFAQETFENEEKGYKLFLKWLSKQSKVKREDWLFCGEYTGLYSRGLSEFLHKKKLFMWLENPLQIKSSWGIKRAKTDRIDSLEIAKYAIRFEDKAKEYKPETKTIKALRILSGQRSRLLKCKVLLEVAAKEMRRVIKHDTSARIAYNNSMQNIERFKKQIASLEDKMHKIIMESEVKDNYLLVNSIKGVGMQTAIALIIHTNNFLDFEDARQLACYCGCAPFEKTSGSSIRGGTHVSCLANKDIKVLLTQCAMVAAQYNKKLSVYYDRKVAEGKAKMVVINNIRNKLIHIIFAVTKHKTLYDENYLSSFLKYA